MVSKVKYSLRKQISFVQTSTLKFDIHRIYNKQHMLIEREMHDQ